MPTPIVLRQRRAKARPALSFRPGPHLALIAVLSLMVLAAGLARMVPADAPTWPVDIASP